MLLAVSAVPAADHAPTFALPAGATNEYAAQSVLAGQVSDEFDGPVSSESVAALWVEVGGMGTV